jgi:hypothetical protein
MGLTLDRFCLELNSARTQQSATIELFNIISQHAKNVPIIIVLTKKDDFIAVKGMEARNKISSAGMGMGEYFAAMDEYAEVEFCERMRTIESELLEIPGGRFDASVGVSRGKLSNHRQIPTLTISIRR